MSLKLIRIARLKEFAATRSLVGPVAIGQAIGKKPNQVSDLLSGKAPFGEKVARSIESYAGLPPNWLDESGSDETDSTDGSRQRPIGQTFSWPFELVDRELYIQLTVLEQGQVQTHMMDEIKSILSSHRKNGTRS